MPTAVLDLDFTALPAEIGGLDRYDRALVLIRLRGRPVGQALLQVVGGRISATELREALLVSANWSFWDHWLRDYLEWPEADQTDSAPPMATVAVCTRDRPQDLQRCLEALMRLPDDGQELLVIDNCPATDATRSLVHTYPRVRYVREDRPGLDVARNRALREAQHEIVAFTDDDAAPDPEWLRALAQNFHDPAVMAVTGLTMPLELETEAQEWFQRLGGFRRGFHRIVFDSENCHPLDGWRAGAGVNMALRRSIVAEVGSFDEALDVGTPTFGGGDNDIFLRILAAGYRIVYDPRALNWHRHRRTWKELRRQLYGYGVGGFAVWMRGLVIGRELDVFSQGWHWARDRLPRLVRSLLGRSGNTWNPPTDLLLAEFLGAVVGPWAYLYSRWQRRSGGKTTNAP